MRPIADALRHHLDLPEDALAEAVTYVEAAYASGLAKRSARDVEVERRQHEARAGHFEKAAADLEQYHLDTEINEIGWSDHATRQETARILRLIALEARTLAQPVAQRFSDGMPPGFAGAPLWFALLELWHDWRGEPPKSRSGPLARFFADVSAAFHLSPPEPDALFRYVREWYGVQEDRARTMREYHAWRRKLAEAILAQKTAQSCT
jgi:hypothetical protein